MRIVQTPHIEYSEINFSELYGDMRIDSQYYEPVYIRNARKICSKPHKPIREFMSTAQYGISIAMNEDGIGYKILKMDDITGIFANDENAKYADISNKLYNQFTLNRFDVLFNRVNSDEFVGRTGIYLLDGEHTFASYLVRLASEHTYQNCYLVVFLNCKYGFNALQRVKRRAVNQANINAQELKDFVVPYPSSSFQKEIEKLVVEAYSLKTNSVNRFKEADKILLLELGLSDWSAEQAAFKIGNQTFQTDKSVSTISIHDAFNFDRFDGEFWQSYLVALIKQVQSFKDGWKPFGEVCNIYDTNFFPENEEEYKYIELANIGFFGNITGYTQDYGENLPTRARRLIRTGQVIVSSIEGSLSSCALITNEYDGCICSNGFHVIDSDTINSETLIVLLKSKPFQHLLRKGCTGTILTAINKRFLSLVPIPNLSGKVQQQIQGKIKEMYKMRKRSNLLLEVAKKAVEVYIEEDENEAIKFIKANT